MVRCRVNPKRRLLLITATCIALGVTVFLALRPGQPSYNGKTLSWWIIAHERLAHRNESIEAIHTIGTNALPYLSQWIVYEPPRPPRDAFLNALIAKLPQAFARMPLVVKWRAGLLRDSQETRAHQAVVAFQMLGPSARPAIPKLIEIVADKRLAESSDRAMEALSGIGDEGISALFAALTSLPQPRQGKVASYLIMHLGRNFNPAALVQRLNDGDPKLAGSVTNALGVLAHYESIAIRTLTQSLDASRSCQVRCAAVDALAHFGARAESALPELVRLLTNSEPRLRSAATNAVLTIELNAGIFWKLKP